MYKSVFSKYLTVVTLVVVLGFLSMTLLQIFLSAGALAEDKRELLQENAENIAHHMVTADTQTHLNNGELEYRFNPHTVRPLLRILAESIDATVLVTDSGGKVLLCAGDGKDLTGHLVDQTFLPQEGADYYGLGNLGGLMNTTRYVAGVAASVNQQVVGYVFVTAAADNMAEILRTNFKVYLISPLHYVFY